MRKRFFLILVLLLGVGAFLLAACETAGVPQPTATSEPIGKPTPATDAETPVPPTPEQAYPDVPPTETPTPVAYPTP